MFLFENFITFLCTDVVAMSSEEEKISALLTASIDLNSKSDEISPEDATWVDSCLVSNPQMSDDRWDTLREAILHTLTAQVESYDEQPSNSQLNEIAQGSEEEKEEETNEYAQVEQIVYTEGDDGDGEDNVESLLGSQQDIESRDSIFKVWELKPQEEDEENELIKQLKKALMMSKFQDASHSDKVLEVDKLVASIGDLSLEPRPEFIQKGNGASG